MKGGGATGAVGLLHLLQKVKVIRCLMVFYEETIKIIFTATLMCFWYSQHILL